MNRSSQRRRTVMATFAVVTATSLVLAGCGAGSRTGSSEAATVTCDIEQPADPIDVNVLAYNSSAIDPFTNTMVKSCSKGDITLKHEPIDFAGQVQKTTATLAGDSGTYDLVETYGFVLPQLASEGKLQPLNDLVDKYSADYGLDALNPAMKEGMTYDGQLYGLPMQAQMYVLAYRKDVFDDLGLQPPTTFAEMRDAAKAIQDAGEIEHPLALPWLASADLATAFDSALGSVGGNLSDPETMTSDLDGPQATAALEAMQSLLPFMDPEVTTYDQPAVQQQMYNGSAAMAIMFSGRMNDLTLPANSQYAKDFAFAAPPAVEEGGTLYNTLSIDGWSIPTNAKTDPDALFQMMAASVSEDASKAAIPAAYPARDGMVDADSSPYAAAAIESIGNVPPAEPYPWTSEISNAILPIVADVVVGNTSVEEGTSQMQDAADKVLAEYK